MGWSITNCVLCFCGVPPAVHSPQDSLPAEARVRSSRPGEYSGQRSCMETSTGNGHAGTKMALVLHSIALRRTITDLQKLPKASTTSVFAEIDPSHLLRDGASIGERICARNGHSRLELAADITDNSIGSMTVYGVSIDIESRLNTQLRSGNCTISVQHLHWNLIMRRLPSSSNRLEPVFKIFTCMIHDPQYTLHFLPESLPTQFHFPQAQFGSESLATCKIANPSTDTDGTR
jgi:hypothetical protein